MRNIKSKPEKNEGVNKNPSIIISVILIYARNTIMPPSLYCSYGFVSFFRTHFMGSSISSWFTKLNSAGAACKCTLHV